MDIEQKLKELEDRIKLLEQRPQYIPPLFYPVYPYSPPPAPQYPYYVWSHTQTTSGVAA